MTEALLYYLIVINIVTFLVYGIDKGKAKQGSWRISEATLLMLAVIGGTIGALLGMQVWRHKAMHKGGVRDVDNIVEGTVEFNSRKSPHHRPRPAGRTLARARSAVAGMCPNRRCIHEGR